MDMGCGCGIISLILGARYQDVQITGVEIQKELAFLAEKNVMQNRLDNRIRILHQDIRNLTRAEVTQPADILVSNPPYTKIAIGSLNPYTSN